MERYWVTSCRSCANMCYSPESPQIRPGTQTHVRTDTAALFKLAKTESLLFTFSPLILFIMRVSGPHSCWLHHAVSRLHYSTLTSFAATPSWRVLLPRIIPDAAFRKVQGDMTWEMCCLRTSATDVGFPSPCCECLWFIKKLLWAYCISEQGKVGIPRRQIRREQTESKIVMQLPQETDA